MTEQMPYIPGIRWEQNKRGGWEAWENPEGAQKRAERKYLGYLGKRKLPGMNACQIEIWINQQREAKLK